MSSLNDLLNELCLEGKSRFYFSEFIEKGKIDAKQAEDFFIPLMANGSILGWLELRCPNCGKDLGTYSRLPQVPDEISCPICNYNFAKSLDYIEIVLEVKEGFFPSIQRTNTKPTAKRHSIDELNDLLSAAIGEEKTAGKGKKFEDFFEALMVREDDFDYIDRHSRSEIGEVDFVYRCRAKDDVLWQISPIICVECKNWAEVIGSEQMDHFINLVREKAPFSSCGVYVTSSYFSPNAETSIRDARIRDKITIVTVEGTKLKDLIRYGFKDYIPRICLNRMLHK